MGNKVITLFAFLLCLSSVTFSQDYAVGLKLSTLGVHAELFRSFGPQFSVHVGGSFFSYNYTKNHSSGDQYSLNADLKLNAFTLLADWMPFEKSSFRVSTGFMYNNNHPNVVAIPEVEKSIGGDVYNKDNLGNMSVKLKFNKINPYIGAGIGNVAFGIQGLRYVIDLGVYYQGSPKVDLSAEGLLSPSASPEQEQIVQDNLRWFKWYPVVSFGLTYTF
jgi:hypothetical protein